MAVDSARAVKMQFSPGSLRWPPPQQASGSTPALVRISRALPTLHDAAFARSDIDFDDCPSDHNEAHCNNQVERAVLRCAPDRGGTLAPAVTNHFSAANVISSPFSGEVLFHFDDHSGCRPEGRGRRWWGHQVGIGSRLSFALMVCVQTPITRRGCARGRSVRPRIPPASPLSPRTARSGMAVRRRISRRMRRRRCDRNAEPGSLVKMDNDCTPDGAVARVGASTRAGGASTLIRFAGRQADTRGIVVWGCRRLCPSEYRAVSSGDWVMYG